ncbi:hypothetical protein ET33_06420, partial [Paenibacillus tyrfis]
GDRLDGIGGFTVYGKIMTASDAEKLKALPIGLVQVQTVNRAVKAGEVITYDAIEQTNPSVIWELRKLQDQALLSGGL